MRPDILNPLFAEITALKGVGAALSKPLEKLGLARRDVVRTRMFVTDVSKWEEVARVHGEIFGEIRPATSIVEVTKLIDGEAQIEIEADAYVP